MWRPFSPRTLAIAASFGGVLVLTDGASSDPSGKEEAKATPPQMHLLPAATWRKTTVGMPAEGDLEADFYKPAQARAADRYKQIIERRQKAGRIVIAPAIPSVVGNVVYYSTDRSIAAVNVRDLMDQNGPVKAGELAWEGHKDFGLVQLLAGGEIRAMSDVRRMAEDWLGRRTPENLGDFFCHRTLATAHAVSADRLAAVDDLAGC